MKGAPPLFSWSLLRKSLTITLLVLLIGLPLFQFGLAPVQSTSPTISVTIVDYAFQPAKINITTGTMVVWTYSSAGKDFHTVSSDPGTNKTQNGNPLLNSGSMSPGQTFSFTFNQPGYYPYQCSYHPTIMNAWVNVTGSPVTPGTPTPQSPLDTTIIGTLGGMVGLAVVATVALFLRRRRKAPVPSTASQNKS